MSEVARPLPPSSKHYGGHAEGGLSSGICPEAVVGADDDIEQLAGALRVIHQAIDELEAVTNALNRRIVKKAA